MITQEKVNKMATPQYSGRYHTLISKERALELLRGTEFENHRTVVHAASESYPDNYFFTLSSFEHVDIHMRCGTPASVNVFFVNDAMDSVQVLTSMPIREPDGWKDLILSRMMEGGTRMVYDGEPFYLSVDEKEPVHVREFYRDNSNGDMAFVDLVRVINLEVGETTYIHVEGREGRGDADMEVKRVPEPAQAFANGVADYWYSQLHGRMAPIRQKQALAKYVRDKLHSTSQWTSRA